MRIALTDRFCAAAKAAGAAQADFFDEKTVGLCLRVSAAGRKTWCLVYTAPSNGKRVRIGLGLYPAVSLADARGKALEARGHVEAGRNPRSVAMADGAMTVTDLVAAYLAKYANGLRSGPAIARRLQKNVVPVIGGVRVADLHRRDITRVIDPILARDAPTEAARVLENLQSALRWGVRRGDLDRNPAEGMTKPAGRPARERVLTDKEIRTLWHGIAVPLPQVTDQRIVKLCLVTAQRVGEVAGMRRDELDLAKRVWALPGSRTKNGNPHSVPLYPTPAWVIAALAEHIDFRNLTVWEPACGDGRMAEALKLAMRPTSSTVTPVKMKSSTFYPGWNRNCCHAPRTGPSRILRSVTGGGFLALLLPNDFDSAKTRSRFFGDCPHFIGKVTLTRRVKWFEHPDKPDRNPKENSAWFLWARDALRVRHQPIILYSPRAKP